MAKKNSTNALTGPRIMTKDVPSSIVTRDNASNKWVPTDGWKPMASGVYYETYFDLSGYTLDDMTTLPNLLQLQDSNAYFLTNPFSDSLVTVLDILSEEPLDPETVSNLAANGDYPSTPGSTTNYHQILMCNVRGMTTQTEFGSVTLLRAAYGGSYGSAGPTTVSKLWCYRIIRIAGTDLNNQILAVPATRFVLAATIVKEAELPYLMRLKRSYELAKSQ